MALSEKLKNLMKDKFKEDAKVVKLVPSLRGKTIIVYGSNSLGKTSQMCQLPNPIIFPLERIGDTAKGAMVLKVGKRGWNDLLKHQNKLLSKDFLDLLQEEQITLIFDGIDKIDTLAEAYVCAKFGAESIKSGNNNFGLYKELSAELYNFFNPLLQQGYTIVGISHCKELKDGKITIKGSERCIEYLRDSSDVIAYVESNGVDENGKLIPSSAYFFETEDYFARTRYKYMPQGIKEFTAENLETTIVEAIKKEIEEDGVEVGTIEEVNSIYTSDADNMTYEEVMEEIKVMAKELQAEDNLDTFYDITDKHLGRDFDFLEADRTQIEALIAIYDDLKALKEN